MKSKKRVPLVLWVGIVATAGALCIGIAEHLYVRSPHRTERLIDSLSRPKNRASIENHVIPGGEVLSFSRPMKELIALGDDARPALHRRLADPQVQNEVALVLGAIGDETTVPLLIDAFPTEAPIETRNRLDPDPVRMKYICFTHALMHLTGMSIGHSRWGTHCDPGNRQQWLEWWAVHKKLFVIGGLKAYPHRPYPTRPDPPADVVFRLLTTALKDDDPRVRVAAARKLSYVKDTAAVPNLIAATADTDPNVRSEAVSAIYHIGHEAKAALPTLLERMRDQDEKVRDEAMRSSARVGGVEALPAFLKMMQESDRELRRLAINGICSIDPKARGALPQLYTATKDKDPRVRSAALHTLRVIDPDGDEVLRALLAGLEDSEPEVRQTCAYNLGEMASRAGRARRQLLGLLGDESPGVRREAAGALVAIGPCDRAAVPTLVAALADPTWEVRCSAAKALGLIGPDAVAAVEALRRALRDRQGNVRWWSADTLGRIGPAAKVAVPDLVAALGDQESTVRELAGKALSRIDPDGTIRAGGK